MREASLPTALEPGGPNALARALGLLGDEWTLLLLRFALLGAKRYSEFRAELPISYAVLTSRLELLVREQIMERRIYQDNPIRAEYLLTDRGRSLWPILTSVWEWERAWVPAHSEVLPGMRHRVCGAEFSPIVCCSNCGKRVETADVATSWGPSGSWPRSVPDATTRRSRRGATRPEYFPTTMAVLGNRWSCAIVGAAFQGISRFTEFQEALTIPPSLLAERLQELGNYGVLEAVRTQARADWAEYRLTDKGTAFFPVVITALQWAETWYRAPEGPSLVWTHRECGAEFTGVLTCDRCATPLHGADIEVVTPDR